LIAVAGFIFVANHCFAFCALFVLRRREPNLPRPFKAWGYPLIPAVVLLLAIGILIGSLFSDPRHSLYALGLIAVSFPVYHALTR
jgi:APA family basic amino acid/polyamine antiporter